MLSMIAAKRLAIGYAVTVGVLSITWLTGTLTSDDVTIKRIIGHASLSIVASLVPLLIVSLGNKVTRSDRGNTVITTAVIAAVASPLALLALALSSREPLAMLVMLFTPAVQAMIGLLGLFLAWRR